MQNEDSVKHLWLTIRRLKHQKTLPAIRQARQILLDWLQQHPGDHSSRDAGEELWMMEEALEVLEAEKAIYPVAA